MKYLVVLSTDECIEVEANYFTDDVLGNFKEFIVENEKPVLAVHIAHIKYIQEVTDVNSN